MDGFERRMDGAMPLKTLEFAGAIVQHMGK